MASSLLSSTPALFTTRSQPTKLIIFRKPTFTFASAQFHQSVKSLSTTANATTTTSVSQLPSSTSSVRRRSGHFLPSIWDDNYLQSLTNIYTGDMYTEKAQKLMGIVRTMLDKEIEPFDQRLELIDSLQRLGLAYQFKAEIENVLEHIHNNLSNDIGDEKCTLHSTALKFRLLREHGYYVSSDIFCSFKDKKGGFKARLGSDLEGMLSLYEASFYGLEGESILDEAFDFTAKYLEDAEKNVDDPNLAKQVKHALEVPLRWKMERLEARWSIEAYERTGKISPVLVELAKLDYNRVQAMHQEEVKDVSRWWKNSNLGVSVSFSRNRLLASYLWGIGIAVEPQFGNCRRMLGKTVSLIGVMDDMYDIYATLEELQLFTDVVDRWDVNEMKQLPDYMKICFLALFNCVNEIAYDVLKEHGRDVVPHLKNAWLGLLRAYLLEAKWYHTGHTPTLKEYMDNAWVSVTAPMIAILCYAVVTKRTVEKDLAFLESHPDIMKLTSMIIRLEDDMGTESDEIERGDIPKSMQCYMRETGASEEAAREYLKQWKREEWKKVNKCLFEEIPLPKSCVDFMVDFAKVSHFFYRNGDGHSVQDHTKELASNLLFEPIHLNYKDN